MSETLTFRGKSDDEVRAVLTKYGIGLTVSEARKVEDEILGRAPTVTEAIAWGIEGSEHCSYKSSKKYLKTFPTEAPNVILGPSEDAGIVSFAYENGERFGVVIAHESHNHPSQIVPYEGAATGVGGIVRDVVCMGARVIAIADPLRFGSLREITSRWVYDGVTAGIGGYGNPIGVPTLAGDVYANESFNGNTLVNVVALGVVRESEIIHSYAPEEAAEHEYDYILVGKATDASGMGGASFASVGLDTGDVEANKASVQEPNAFLKRHLMVSTYDLFARLKDKHLLDKVGFKDLGGGGLLCASVEMAEHYGHGAKIDLSKVSVSVEGLPAPVTLCAETQERFLWVCDPSITQMILEHYNNVWALPKVARGAGARVVGTVTEGNYKVESGEGVEVDAPARAVTEGLSYDRPVRERLLELDEPAIEVPYDLSLSLLTVLGSPQVASRAPVYEQYDKQVQGQVILEAGQADAGVMLPFVYERASDEVKRIGLALSVDGNPRYGRISAYWQGANAVVEAMRNVAAVGATPWALTDCLNYGNPEVPEDMWDFVQGVRGVGDAARGVHLKGYDDSPVPIVSGNVSFYNESRSMEGERRSVDPSAIVSCVGRLTDGRKAITHQFKQQGSSVIMVGERKDELGGSAYYETHGELGARVPMPDFAAVKREIYAVIDVIDEGLAYACHDISDGGLGVALSEMCFGGSGLGRVGAAIDLGVLDSMLLDDIVLFSETGGFVMEIAPEHQTRVVSILEQYGVYYRVIGRTTGDGVLDIRKGGVPLVNVSVSEMASVWLKGLRERVK